ncbi:MAG: hypothetical protein PHH98_00090 [Candidatus Gracilibacteria bacterium]|nr:hypothetical protein [Candidatus Gracilibacteria bacterium]
MNAFLGTLIGNLVISISIIFIIFLLKTFKKNVSNNIEYVTSITIGVIFGIIFLGFIPEVLDSGNLTGTEFGLFILLGIIAFYFLELFLHWHHCKDLSHEASCGHNKGLQKEHLKHKMMFFGTILHNFIHGIVLFSAFSINLEIGIATTVAILLHSIPQNISNYFMNHKDEKNSYIASFGGVFGAILTFPFIDFLINNQFKILLLICGGLLYIALTDIFPEIKDQENTKKKVIYFLLLTFGILLFFLFGQLIHNFE